jgi:hypothetical protein
MARVLVLVLVLVLILILILLLAPTLTELAAKQPSNLPQNPQPAPPVFVSPGNGIPFRVLGRPLPFDTGDFLLSDSQGLALAGSSQ